MGTRQRSGLPALTAEERELQSKFALILKKRKQLRELKAKAQTVIPPKRPSSVLLNNGGGAREAAKKVLASEAVKQQDREVPFKRPKLIEKKAKDPLLRPLDDPPSASTVQPFRSVLSGGPEEARRDYHNRFVSVGSLPPAKRHHRDQQKCNTVQVSGRGLTEDLLRERFASFGEIKLIKVNTMRNLGFVGYVDPQCAEIAAHKTDNTFVGDGTIQVVLIEDRAIQAADFSQEAIKSPWASLAAGVTEKRRESRQMIVYGDDPF